MAAKEHQLGDELFMSSFDGFPTREMCAATLRCIPEFFQFKQNLTAFDAQA